MKDNKLTDKAIIKALECCGDEEELHWCTECPYYDKENDFCQEDLHRYALDLINRQQAEIERLKPLEENFDKLLYMLNAVDIGQSVLEKQKHQIKAEAIKEFAGKIADVFCSHDKGDAYVREVVYNLVKEMVGEDK